MREQVLALRAKLGTIRSDKWQAAQAVSRHLARGDEAEPPAQPRDDEGARLLLAPRSKQPPLLGGDAVSRE